MACRVGIFAVFEMIISPGPCQSRTFEIQCDGILAKRQIFRRSSAVEQVTVNHLVTGSNPVVGANNQISQATGSHPWGKAGGKGRIVTESGDFSFLLCRFHRRPAIGFEPVIKCSKEYEDGSGARCGWFYRQSHGKEAEIRGILCLWC